MTWSPCRIRLAGTPEKHGQRVAPTPFPAVRCGTASRPAKCRDTRDGRILSPAVNVMMGTCHEPEAPERVGAIAAVVSLIAYVKMLGGGCAFVRSNRLDLG